MRAPVDLRFVPFEHRSDSADPWRVTNDPASIEVTSPFGWRDIGNGPYYHAGLDIANGHYGAALVAPAAGKVVAEGFLGWPWAQPGNFYGGSYGGLQVYVEVPGGLILQFAHMNDTVVSAGDPVAEGQLLGHIGATGNTRGQPHCHHGIIRASVSAIRSKGYIPNEWCVDPAPYYFGGAALPDTAIPEPEDDMTPVPLRVVREQWLTRASAPYTELWTGGPGIGDRKVFEGATRVWSIAETLEGGFAKGWRIVEINGEGVWVPRAQLVSIPGTRSPVSGYGLPSAGYSAEDLQTARAAGEAAGRVAGITAAREALAELE